MNGGAATVYTAPVAIQTEGMNTFSYFSTDTEGNVEAARSIQVKLDKTAPSAVLTQSGQPVKDVTDTDTLLFT
ncbi:MAG: endonuclease, partial [Paenibacillus sp.]|nr:endonuclease [Paenibacillus sp.]